MPLHSKLTVPEPRKSEGIAEIDETEFKRRFEDRFKDPLYDRMRAQVHELANIAWDAHKKGNKAPFTRKAGACYKDPDYDISVDWLNTKEAIDKARLEQENPATKSKILVISGANRNDKTCPGEVSKSRRLAQIAQETIEKEFGYDAELLDLSLVTSEFGKQIHPCKGCVSTAMPLCHFPCSCYPNYSLGQNVDWMNEIYPKWVGAHGIIIVTPVYWYQTPSALKLMIDRLVCADGGNTDPSSTHGKKAKEAKEIEADGWDFPKHLKGRAFGLVVHGDSGGTDHVRTSLSSWARDMQLINSGNLGEVSRYIGYYEPYYLSHQTLDKDTAMQEEARNVARSVSMTIKGLREEHIEKFVSPDLKDPRPK